MLSIVWFFCICHYYPDGITRTECPYLKRFEVVEKKKPSRSKKPSVIRQMMTGKLEMKGGKKPKKSTIVHRISYRWKLPDDVIVIFDEAHRCKNQKTLTSELLQTMVKSTIKILLISATVADRPSNFIVAGYVLQLYKDLMRGRHWISRVGRGFENPMSGVHDEIYPEYASRMRIRDLKNLFPDNQVIAECYEMETADEIAKQYEIIAEAEEELARGERNSVGLGKIIKARQRIEILKVPTYLKMARDFLDEGASVAIFTNFTDTLLAIAHELDSTCLIYGEQTAEERQRNIEDFQEDRERVIIANIRAGGVGISLHDTRGKYPRISIISPSWSAQDVIQALGRVHRAKTKTPVRQRLVFCRGTVEESICEAMKSKIENIGQLNDGDLDSYQIEGLFTQPPVENTDQPESSAFETLYRQLTVLNLRKTRLQEELAAIQQAIDLKIGEIDRVIEQTWGEKVESLRDR